MTIVCACVCILIFGAAIAFAQETLYINGQSGSDSNSCQQVNAACKTFQGAMQKPGYGPVTIYIAAGVYTGPSNVNTVFENEGPQYNIIGIGVVVFDASGVTDIVPQWTFTNSAPVLLENLGFTQYPSTVLDIACEAPLVVANCDFFSNSLSPGGILSFTLNPGGSAMIANSTFSDSSGGGQAVILQYLGTHAVTFFNCTFSNINAGGYYGSVLSGLQGAATFVSCTFQNNLATSEGPVFQVSSSAVTMINCLFVTNSAGTGLFLVQSTLMLQGCIFQSNQGQASGLGGAAVVVNGGFVNISSSAFNSNFAPGGGAIFLRSGTLIVSDSVFSHNTVVHLGANGGAIWLAAGSAVITNSQFIGNQAVAGGGLYLDGASSLVLSGNTWTNNVGSGSGGAIYLNSGGSVSMSGSTFISNQGTSNGGAIYSAISASMTSLTFKTNSAMQGGALYLATGSFTLNNLCFENNSALTYGGAMASAVSISATEITASNNRAVEGGALYLFGPTSAIAQGFIGNNVAALAGGGIACNSATTLTNITGLLTNQVGSQVNTGTAAAVCLSSACTIYTNKMPALNASCEFHELDIFYVSPTGVDVPRCGALAAPCASIAHAISLASAPIRVGVLGTLSESNSNIIGPVPSAVEIFGQSQAVSTIIGAMQLVPGDSLWIHDLTIQLDSTYVSVLVTQASLTLTRVTVTGTAAMYTATVVQPLVSIVASAFVADQVTFGPLTVGTQQLAGCFIQVTCPSPCSTMASIQNSQFLQVQGLPSLLLQPGSQTQLSSVSVVDCTSVTAYSVISCAAHASNMSTLLVTSGLFARNQGGSTGGVFNLAGCAAVMQNCTFAENSAMNGGAAFVSSGSVTVSDTTFTNNTATYGGAFAVDGQQSSVNISGSLSLNAASLAGGAIFVGSGNVVLSNANLVRNNALNGGACGISGPNAFLVMSNSLVMANTASNSGPALWVSAGAQLTLQQETVVKSHAGLNNGAIDVSGGSYFRCDDSSISENTAVNNGGAVASLNGVLSFHACLLANNSAGSAGGGIFISQSVATFSASTWLRSTAAYGAAMYALESQCTATSATFESNTATLAGGAVMAVQSTLAMGGAVLSNTALDGGGLMAFASAVNLTSIEFAANSATDFGGAACIVFGSLIAQNANLQSNIALVGGAIAAQLLEYLDLRDCVFTANAGAQGGALQATNIALTVQLNNVTFERNAATAQGGAVYVQTSLVCKNCMMLANQASQGAAVLATSDLALFNCSILLSQSSANSAVSVGAIDGSTTSATTTNLVGCDFEGNAGGAFSQTSGFVNAELCRFRNNSNTNSGAAVSVKQNCILQASSCQFASNNAHLGGAISASQSSIAVQSTQFSSNTAASGGAVYLDQATLQADASSTFVGNNATYGGGGAGFSQQPTAQFFNISTGCLLLNNSAAYGNDFATAADRLVIEGSTALTAISGTLINVGVVVNILDAFSHIVTTGVDLILLLPQSSQTTISGIQFAQTSQGTAVFAPMSFAVVATPNSTVEVGVYSLNGFGSQSLAVHLLGCAPGEQLSNVTNRCVPCVLGTYKGIVGMEPCNDCPSGSTTMIPGAISVLNCTCKPGYFINSNFQCEGCQPGQYEQSGVCQTCPPGTVSVNAAATSCVSCLFGSLADANATMCVCTTGYGLVQYQQQLPICELCTVNSYKNASGNVQCSPCPLNSTSVADSAKCQCVAGFKLMDGVCIPCPAGFIATLAGSTECSLCVGNTYAANSGSSTCLLCPVNTVSSADRTECTCNPGYEAAESNVCTACQPGTAKPTAGIGPCTTCPTGSYAAGTGATICSEIPDDAIASGKSYVFCGLFASPNLNRTACLCQPGFQLTSTTNCAPCNPGSFKAVLANTACMSCPEGSFAAEAGALACNISPPNSITIDNGTAVLDCPQHGVQCAGSAVVSQAGFFTVLVNGTIQALSCNPGACIAAAAIRPAFVYHPATDASMDEGLARGYYTGNNQCSSNRAGFLCGMCANGTSYSSSGACVDCPGISYGRLIGQLCLNWVIVVCIYMLFSGEKNDGSGEAIKLMIEFAQIAILLSPDSEMNNVLQLLNVQVPTLGSCTFAMDYYGWFVQRLVTPTIQIALLLISYALAACLGKCFQGESPSPNRWLVAPFVTLLIASYEPITDAALSMLHCVNVAGLNVLADAPGFECSSPRYTPYKIVSIAMVGLVTIGFPVIFGCVMIALRSKLESPTVKSSIGGLYGGYRASARYWLIVSLLRRTVVVSVQLLASPQLAAALSALTIAVSLVFHRLIRPHESDANNRLQEIAFFALLLISGASGFAAFGSGDPSMQNTVVYLEYFIAVLGLCTLAVMFMLALWHMRANIVGALTLLRSGMQLARVRARSWSSRSSVKGNSISSSMNVGLLANSEANFETVTQHTIRDSDL